VGCLLATIGFGLVLWDLLSIKPKPKLWKYAAWTLFVVGVVLFALGI
jgi:hypothetical protein